MNVTRLAPGIIERRFTEIGRIRLGDKSEKGAPRKLTKFRLTSSHADVLARVADVYGGTVAGWDSAPTGKGTQSELYVEADALDVMVPPGQVLTQAYELWSGGGCQRRCNGVALETGEPCVCPIDPHERAELAKNGKACKLTTRLSVWLPKVPGIGVWRLESHGFYAALELPGAADLLNAASEQGRPIPATLRIASRVVKRDGKTNQFIVPQLEPAIPIPALMAVAAGEHVAELDTPTMAALDAPTPSLPAAAVVVDAEEIPSIGKVLIERLKGLNPEQQAVAKTVAANAKAKLSALYLDEHPDFAEQVRAWLDAGAPVNTAAPDPTAPEHVQNDDDPERPF